MDFWLIQRGVFKDNTEVDGLDSIIAYDYMGNAEYEFGALPESYQRMKEEYKNHSFIKIPITINELPFMLYISKAKAEHAIKIAEFFTGCVKQPYGKLKNPIHIDKYFEGKTLSALKRNCKKKRVDVRNYGYCDFWWDIVNDFMVIPAAPYYVERLDKALTKMERV